jgi:uncharacterized protein (TIGR03083 family)
MESNVSSRSTKRARRSALDRDTAMALAATEYERVVDMFETCTPQQWATPTDCPGWDVRAMAGHMLGMAQMVATFPELLRQQVASQISARKNGGLSIDALTALQVAKNASLSTPALVENMKATAPRALRGRRRVPALVRNLPMPEAQIIGGQPELWTFGFLFDIILTRDPFMHRIDISAVTGIDLQATAEHEGVLVDDIVGEWAARHGQDFRLELSGPAGGIWGRGEGAPTKMDAFAFCRVLAGRKPATGLLAEQVPF